MHIEDILCVLYVFVLTSIIVTLIFIQGLDQCGL